MFSKKKQKESNPFTHTFKIALIGQKQSGKSAFINQCINNNYSENFLARYYQSYTK